MAISVKITDGRHTIEYVYAAGSQTDFKAMLNAQSVGGDPRAIVHVPDVGESTPAYFTELDKTFELPLDILGTDWDDVLNNIAMTKRLVDGANSQAGRYWTHGDVAKVVVRIQLNGATNYTDWAIKWGTVDDSGAYYTDAAQVNTRGRGVVLRLRTAPYGQGAALTLNNKLKNSNFQYFNSGVALGWNNLSAATLAQDTGIYLLDKSSQKITPAGAGDGINSDTVTNASDTLVAVYAWIQPGTNASMTLQLYDVDGAASVDTQALTSAQSYGEADRTVVGPDGNTWYRITVKGSVTSGNDVQARIYSSDIGTPFYVGCAYLQFGVTAAPAAGWVNGDVDDGFNLDNRNDRYSNDATRINYVHFWDIPGDTDALIDYAVSYAGAGESAKYDLIFGSVADGLEPAGTHQFVIEGEDLTQSGGGGTFADAAAANQAYHAGDYKVYTNNTGSGQNLVVYYDIQKDKVPYGVYRVFMVCRTDDATVPETVAITSFLGGDYDSTAVGLSAANNFEMLDLGRIAISDFVKIQVLTGVGGATNVRLQFTVTGVANTKVFDIDCIFLVPTQHEYMQVEDSEHDGSNVAFNVDVDRWPNIDIWQSLNTTSGRVPVVGSKIATVKSGYRSTRIYCLSYRNSNNDYDAEDTFQISSLTVIPRTRHLLGTL